MHSTTPNMGSGLGRRAAVLLLALIALITTGCGSSDQDYVFTGSPNNTPATGNVVFNFTRAQGAINVPSTTTTLQIIFYSGTAQTGTVTRQVTVPFAASVTVTDVPTSSRSFRVTARDANGFPLQQSSGEISVVAGQTTTANLTNATSTPITLSTVTTSPDGSNLAIAATQQFSLSGQFSNGESLTLPAATFVSSNPGVASITSAGLATGVSGGSTNITGTFNGVSDVAALTVTGPIVSPTEIDLLVSNNGTSNKGELDLFDRINNFVRTFVSGNNEGIAADKIGTGYHNGDDPSKSVRILSRIATRSGAFNLNLDREVADAAFNAIKGSALAQQRGLLILTDFGSSQLHVLGTSGTTLLTSVTTAGGKPWDAAYDEANDRLYVAFTNGTIGVFDTWIAGGFSGTANRTITPTGSINAHGIAFTANTLIVSDVGDAAVATDGKIFVVPNAATANGAVAPSATIAGSNTLLGNPVDIDFVNGDLRVAEKSNDALLIFSGILTSTGGNIAPTLATAETKPESLTSLSRAPLAADNSDIDGGITVQNLIVTSHPAAADTSFARVNPALTVNTALALTVATGESVKIDTQGDAYITSGAGVIGVGRLGASVRDSLNFNSTRDRNIATLSGAKGLDVVDTRGLTIVARTSGTPSIVVYGKTGGSGTPLFTTPTAAAPWDVDYDPKTDRLFVAFTNGTVGVYDNYLDGASPNTATPSRIITPAGSVNLHGIVYDATNNVLLLSDVGSAASATDGQIFVVAGASTANGTVAPTVTIGGAATNLGNPVDVAYDGTNLYVAEKSNDVLLRYNNIRTSPGGNIAAAVSLPFIKPESISLVTGL